MSKTLSITFGLHVLINMPAPVDRDQELVEKLDLETETEGKHRTTASESEEDELEGAKGGGGNQHDGMGWRTPLEG